MKQNLDLRKALLALISVAAVAPAMAATETVIDDFGTTQPSLTLTFPPAGTTASSSVSGAGILGGERDVQISLTSGVIAGNTLSGVVSSGFFSYSQDATISGNALLQWDGGDSSPTFNAGGLGAVDLTGGGSQDALRLDIVFDDLPINSTITIATNAGNQSIATLALPGLIFSSTAYSIPFSAFTPSIGTGANFASVGAVSLNTGSSVTAPDLVVDKIAAVSLLDATQTVTLTTDNHDVGLANPGDVLHYVLTVSNPADASGASESNVKAIPALDPNVSLVVGSVTSTVGTIASGNAGGDTTVEVDIGALADATSATITYDVSVNNPLPGGTVLISNQVTVSSTTLGALLSDDPGQPGNADATTIAASTTPVTLQHFSVD